MCSLCRMYPCDRRCPNALDLRPVAWCKTCGEGIFEGDKYFEDLNGEICKECMDDMSAEEILELLGEKFKVAEVV